MSPHPRPARARAVPARPAPPGAPPVLLVLGAVVGVVATLAALAPVRRHPQHQRPARPSDVDRVLRDAGATGPGHPVWRWNPAFRAGEPGAEPLLPTSTWVAPVGEGGRPHGTVTATQGGDGDAGRLSVAAPDADAELARALLDLSPDEVLLSDGPDWLGVRGDQVRPLLPPPRRRLDRVVGVGDFRTGPGRRTAAPPGVAPAAGTA